MKLIDYAKLCQQSYDDKAVGYVTVGDLRFGIIDNEHEIIVVFRGSDNGTNWLRDLAAIPVETRSGYKAHHGFVGALDTLREAVGAALPAGKPVCYTGHSLGGAIAVLFAQENRSKCVTFGCPRVWWDLDAAPPVDHVRVIADDDPVPMIPHFLFKHDTTCEVTRLRDGGFPVDPEDHFITHYIARLEALDGGMA